MDLTPTKQGKVPIKIPAIPDTECFTSYKVFGDLSRGTLPLLALHGGPGSAHEYMITFANLWDRYGIPVVLYDQVGCGASTHLKQFEGDPAVWNESTFMLELDNVIDHLELRKTGFNVLGHSWGGMLAAAWASTHPKGLNRLILASSPAHVHTYMAGVKSLYEQFPPDLVKAIEEAQRTGDYSSAKYKEAALLFLERHYYRLKPFPPPELEKRMEYQANNPTPYRSMFGPSALTCTGTLKDWSCVSRVPKINVPTLLYNAEFDSTTDAAVAPLFELIPRVRWISFPGGGHMCHLEGELRDKVLKAVHGFLVAGKTE
ncbi:hypothetical protein PRZ48_014681 [Zasmidium cellare]|uniref:AB hydrolase-1 domain-containing protein n=1 Tax=Zasmidium cellare TaxID=395010 RepID=A0ABR0DZM8_ZASCE|nr:hypothetical protein PRZ48_014681 [Zasmidium cellare]